MFQERSDSPSLGLVRIDGVEIITDELGPGDPVAEVVLCHGTPWSAEVWRPVAERLARTHRVLLWDMPGYGASITTEAPVDLVAQRQRLAALVEAWGLDRPHVVAHDIGGAVALGAHLLEGLDVASLFLLDVVTLDPWGSPFFRLVAEHESVFAALPPNLHEALVREYVAGAARSELDPTWIDELVRPWTSATGQAAFYRQIAQLVPEHTRPIVDRLGDVRAPVRIAWGSDDPWIPVEQADRLAAALPGDVEVRRLEGVGHLGPVEATHEVADLVLEWLR